MKKVTIIGASGFIGSAILNEVLSRGYQVRAIVRNPEKITVSNPQLQVIKADVMNEENLVDLLCGEASVISAY
ncbi:MAG: NAD(P)-dependent oxidoreductase, partial [Bacteroidales bacterium]